MPCLRLPFALLMGLFAVPITAQDPTPRPALQISQETTYFTEPVNADGTIDYVAAINQYLGKGVDPQDNAFALMLPLLVDLDPTETQRAHYTRLFAELGLDLDAEGPRFSRWSEYAAQQDIDSDQADWMFGEAMTRPWKRDELPHVAAWIEQNAPAYAELQRALSLEHYYAPLIRHEDDMPMVAVLLPQLGQQRQIARQIAARAFMALATDEHAAVMAYLNELHRMGSLISEEPILIGKLVGISVQSLQTKVVEALAERGALDRKLAKQYLAVHREVGTIDNIKDAVDLGERCMSLDIIQRASMGKDPGLQLFMELEGAEQSPNGKLLVAWMERMPRSRHFDVNRSLRRVNQLFDRQQAIHELPDLRTSRQADAVFNEELDDRQVVEDIFLLQEISTSDALVEGWTADRYTDAVTALYVRLLMPALGAAVRTEGRNNTRRLVESTAIALLGYRDEHGKLPDSLEALVPEYFEAVPLDFATGEPLVYRVNEDGSALVYSFGDNFVDDGGVDDYKTGDIAIRIGPGPE